MYPTTEYRKLKLKEFLSKWSLRKIENLTLRQYALGNQNTKQTYSYWLEEETSELGGIGGFGGGGAFRFGVYYQKNPRAYPKKSPFISKNGYGYKRDLGDTPYKAFNKIHKLIIKIIKYAQQGNFKKIDELENEGLFYTVVWKIAYLYSNERINPFFSLSLLRFVAKHLRMKNVDEAARSEMHLYISKHRPRTQSLNDFSVEMWKLYSKGHKRKNISDDDPALEGNKFPEGKEGRKIKKAFKEHLVRERDTKFRNKYRKLMKHVINCPGCSLDANKKYNLKNPNRFLEMHHIEPLKHRKKSSITTVNDVILLCPSCHRAIHRMMSENDERKISLVDFRRRLN